MWKTAWALYRHFMPRSLPWVLEREARYRSGALRVAVRAGIIDALTAAEDPNLRRDVPLYRGKA